MKGSVKIKSSLTGKETDGCVTENPPEYYLPEVPEEEVTPLDPKEAQVERDAMDVLEEMCTQSLPPELYEKWVEVSAMLRANRRAFKNNS